jgi:hypothetical protein
MSLRRLVVMSFGFVVAAAAGMLFLPIAALFDDATREAGVTALLSGLVETVTDAMELDAPDPALAAIGFVIWAVGIATCAAPLAIAALIGEVAGVRAYTWYAGASALLAAASPWIARAAHGSPRAAEMSATEGRFALLFFLTGALTGSIYWAIAVRGPGDRARLA